MRENLQHESMRGGCFRATHFIVLAIVAVSVLFGPFSSREVCAGVVGNWYDESGNPISLPQAVWNATTPEGNITYSYSGVNFEGLVGHVTFDARPLSSLDSVDAFMNGGPNETSVSVPLPLPPGPVSVNLGTTVRFNVTIDGSRTALLNQNATLDSLSVEAGSRVDCQSGKSLALRTGNSQNAGTITQAIMSLDNGATFSNTGSGRVDGWH